MAHGMRLDKIHRILTYHEEAYIKPFVDTHAKLRKESTSAVDKDYHKAIVNFVYGKTMESVRDRKSIRLATKRRKMSKYANSPFFLKWTQFDEEFCAAHMASRSLKLWKPIFIGAQVLEHAKLKMYKFWYDFVKPKWGDKCHLVVTDTDSFQFSVETDDLYRDLRAHHRLFDLSHYANEHPIFAEASTQEERDMLLKYKEESRAKIGLMKDEAATCNILDIIGLKAKCYAKRYQDGEGKCKIKGIKKSVVKNKINFDTFESSLMENKIHYAEMTQIRSQLHRLKVIRQRKLALYAYDDKRFLLANGEDTLPYGHYKIRQDPEHC
jgi:hypothetical protein